MPMYDAQELRRRMAVCFTIGELYRLAEKLGVPPAPSWSNSPQDASRDIVRHFDRSGALPFLVEALQEAKPLVEWPEPELPPAPSPAAPPPPEAGPTVLGAPAAAILDEPTSDTGGDRPTPIVDIGAIALFAKMKGQSGPPDAPVSPRPTVPGPEAAAAAGFAPAIMPRPGEAPAPAPAPSAPQAPVSAPQAAAPARAEEEVEGDLAAFMAVGEKPAAPAGAVGTPSPATAWPGTVRPAGAPPARTLPDYRILAGAGAAVLVGAIAIAFFVGRASSTSSGSDEGTTSGQGTTSDRPALSTGGDHAAVSEHVVRAVMISLERVARDCKIDLGTLRGRSLFEVAYRRCGPLPPQAMDAPQAQGPSSDVDPLDPPPGGAPPDPPAKGRPGGGNKLQKVDPRPGGPGGGAGAGCLSRCTQSHGACTSRCGAEPKQGSQYDAYQACLGGCLKAMSQCKLGCQ
jgi:hypothetical protein